MRNSPIRPRLLMADPDGNIVEHPKLLMVCKRGREWMLPRPDELIVLPPESELFLLPGRNAVGFDAKSGAIEVLDTLAVAAFGAPAYTLTAHAAYVAESDAPTLPLFAYGAVGFAKGRFYMCARKVDGDTRQEFRRVAGKNLARNVQQNLDKYPDNRLMQHIMQNCVLKYDCPAAKNLALGRYEAPLPTSRSCNARCVGCISMQEEGSIIKTTPQCRLEFSPTPQEIVEIMRHHEAREKELPIYSFGQGCEGEPLTQSPILVEAIRTFREGGGHGTININTNASMPRAVIELADAGLTSMRVSINSAREGVYNAYYRPQGYRFESVRQSIIEARKRDIHVSLNLLYFPGVTDTEDELDALIDLVGACGVNFIQLRNLNIDPEIYLDLFENIEFGPSMGFTNFKKRLRKMCPWITFGYFNPWLGDKATLTAPMPGEWQRPEPTLRESTEQHAIDIEGLL